MNFSNNESLRERLERLRNLKADNFSIVTKFDDTELRLINIFNGMTKLGKEVKRKPPK